MRQIARPQHACSIVKYQHALRTSGPGAGYEDDDKDRFVELWSKFKPPYKAWPCGLAEADRSSLTDKHRKYDVYLFSARLARRGFGVRRQMPTDEGHNLD